MADGRGLCSGGLIAGGQHGKIGERELHPVVDLRDAAGQDAMLRLLDGAAVFLQSYRPGSLAARGFGAGRVSTLARLG